MVGQVIGHYYIDAQIGEGEFSVVYKGRDIRLDRTVAVKVLKERHPQGSTTWGRLLREARIASTLNHPNICTLHDIGEEQDINYIVFEFVEGKTLRSVLESGPLPTKSCLIYAMQIAEAIAHANGAGVLHLDLKSSNIMVTPAGRIKLIDFGLARIMQEKRAMQSGGSGSSTQEIGWLAGTLPYMAPELLHGDAPTTQAGVWSLGVILFEMLTGQLPFVGRTPFELGMEIMMGSISQLPADIPAALRAIVHRCLVRNKECRYYSAVEVSNYLNSEFIAFEVKAVLAGRHSLEIRGHRHNWLGSALMWLSLLCSGN